jgi:Uma2 family endonuclease
MATAVEPNAKVLTPEQRIIIPGVGWEGYETMLKWVGDGHVRITYDRGDLELMSPSTEHEEYAELFGQLIFLVTLELGIPFLALGTTTWRKQAKDRGLEADKCFYLASLPRIRGKKHKLDLGLDPPPDLAIEIEISRSALNRMGIYAALRVPEVWRFDGETLRIDRLRDDRTYEPAASSRFLPVPPAEVVRWVAVEEADDDNVWARRLRDWVRATLAPPSPADR